MSLRQTTWGRALARFVETFPSPGYDLTMMEIDDGPPRDLSGMTPEEIIATTVEEIKDTDPLFEKWKNHRISGEDPTRALDEIFGLVDQRMRAARSKKIFFKLEMQCANYFELRDYAVSVTFYPEPIVEHN